MVHSCSDRVLQSHLDHLVESCLDQGMQAGMSSGEGDSARSLVCARRPAESGARGGAVTRTEQRDAGAALQPGLSTGALGQATGCVAGAARGKMEAALYVEAAVC